MLHFAQANTGLAFIGTGYKNEAALVFRTPTFGKSPTAQTKDSVIYYVNTSYDFVIEAIKNLDFDKLTETVSWEMPGGKAYNNPIRLVAKSIRTSNASQGAMHYLSTVRWHSAAG
jgi:hypothetical protein